MAPRAYWKGYLSLPLALLAMSVASAMHAAPAEAAAARTFVSAAGSDGNNCSNTATPCRHLAAAYAATAPNGEIYVLDPANYGSLTITGPVSIEGHGWASIAPATDEAAITISANTGDEINIIGVVLDGTAIANTTGIAFKSGGSLYVRDSVIRNFTQNGISFSPNASGLSQIFVSNTAISDNGENGIFISPSGSGKTTGIINHVEMENNVDSGLDFQTSTQTIGVTVNDSVSASNQTEGILADSRGGTTISIMVRNSTIANNSVTGVETIGTGATLRVTRSTITGNGTGWVGTVLSYGDNNIDVNGAADTEPPNPLTYK